MIRPNVPDVHISDGEDAELSAYRPLTSQAVAGLVIGLAAPLALVDPLLWGIPLLGAFFAIWAIRRIKKSDNELTGRRMAAIGLLLSLAFGVAAPAAWLAHRRIVAREARQFAESWFENITKEEPELAHQLTVAPHVRRPADPRDVWAFYRENPKLRQELEGYVGSPLVRTLLALGPKAQVRFYDTIGQTIESNMDVVDQVFAVTFEEDGEKKSFFVLIETAREELPSGGVGWRILRTESGFRPQSP